MRALDARSPPPSQSVFPKVNIPYRDFGFMQKRLVGACVVCLSEQQCVSTGVCVCVCILSALCMCVVCVFICGLAPDPVTHPL